MPVGAAIVVGAVIGLAIGIAVTLTTDVPLAPEVGAVLGGLVGWLSAGTVREALEAIQQRRSIRPRASVV
jgi:hypothetical protein